MVQIENTPKALANFSPGFEAKREPWVLRFLVMVPRVVAALQPWAESSERLRLYFKLNHYPLREIVVSGRPKTRVESSIRLPDVVSLNRR